MAITRFMEVMFSNTDEELANQVDRDIKAAQENGAVDTEEVNCNNYKQNGLDNLTQYNDFKEFLRLKKQYEGN